MVLCKCSINVISAINSKEVVQCNEDSKISILQELLDGCDQTLVCTSSLVEALELKKVCFLYYKINMELFTIVMCFIFSYCKCVVGLYIT